MKYVRLIHENDPNELNESRFLDLALIRFDNPVFRIQTTAKDSQSYIFIALPIG